MWVDVGASRVGVRVGASSVGVGVGEGRVVMGRQQAAAPVQYTAASTLPCCQCYLSPLWPSLRCTIMIMVEEICMVSTIQAGWGVGSRW